MNRPLIKICGITRMSDALLCASLGANMLGFIFHEPSPRNAVPKIVRAVPRGGPLKVGVFVRQSGEEIARTMKDCRLDLAQLHGDHDVETCEFLGRDRVMKVLWPERYDSARAFEAETARFAPHCRHLLFDAGTSGGGHGTSIDFSRLENMNITSSWLLAGGIGPANAMAAAALKPSGLDVNSGVESAPGIKDETKLRELFSLLRNM